MPKGLIGRKLGMTQVFTENGELLPVTVIEVTPNVVVQKKTTATDGYEAVQLGYGEKRESLINKPLKGHLQKAGVKSVRRLREFRVEDSPEMQALNVGDTIGVPRVTGSSVTAPPSEGFCRGNQTPQLPAWSRGPWFLIIAGVPWTAVRKNYNGRFGTVAENHLFLKEQLDPAPHHG